MRVATILVRLKKACCFVVVLMVDLVDVGETATSPGTNAKSVDPNSALNQEIECRRVFTNEFTGIPIVTADRALVSLDRLDDPNLREFAGVGR